MIDATICINGVMVGHIYAHNTGSVTRSGKCNYDYKIYDVNKGAVASGVVTHDRENGMFILIKRIIDDYDFMMGV